MTQDHDWPDCRPVILEIKDGRVADERIPAALEMAWSIVPDMDRRLFHLYCCHNVHTAATYAALVRIAAIVKPCIDSAKGI